MAKTKMLRITRVFYVLRNTFDNCLKQELEMVLTTWFQTMVINSQGWVFDSQKPVFDMTIKTLVKTMVKTRLSKTLPTM